MLLSEVAFLTLDDIVSAHDTALALYGGSPGVRDANLLASAVAAPESGFGDVLFYPTLARMAAVMAYQIARFHVFSDGNKRAGLAAAVMFLNANGFDLKPDQDPDRWEKLMLGVAAGVVTLDVLAGHLAAEMGGDVDVVVDS